MPLIYVGIDEAGYGPLLGPLTVAASTFRVDDWQVGSAAPDLWDALDACVCRKGRDPKSRIAVDDSKKLKLAKDGTRHPLTHLERGVLSFLSVCPTTTSNSAEDSVEHELPADDAALLERLGAKLEKHPWYYGEPAALPVSESTVPSLKIAANQLRIGLNRAGVSCLGIACKAMGESLFNQTVQREHSKAACTAKGVAFHLQQAWDNWAPTDPDAAGSTNTVRVVCDRQGGRVDYEDNLAQMVPGSTVAVLEQRPERSRYELTGVGSDGRPRAMTVLFMPEAETHHLPVALASMTAKYVRELVMGRFNRYWNTLMPELKPTAGYREDGARWLRDAGPIVSAQDRATMCRIA